LNYDAKAKQHELIASQMKWLIDDLDVLEYTCLVQGKNKNKNNNNNNNDSGKNDGATAAADDDDNDGDDDDDDDNISIKKAFEKVESDFFSSTQTIQTVLPDKIGLAYSKLQFELKLLRVSNTNSVYSNDDKLYYRVVEFAYSELAVILGGRILYLPTPEESVKMTIDRVNALLPTTVQRLSTVVL